jgi:hypothetical protein
LLLTAKSAGGGGMTVSWYDPVKERNFRYEVSHSDWSLWLRFFMSFLVNGVGFHVLVHALPIQVAAQSTFLMVVFRSVGMMHLVDMDDTAGYTLRLEESSSDQSKKQQQEEQEEDLAAQTQKILDEARAKLDALGKEKRYKL